MAINLELPRKLKAVAEKGHQGAAEMLRPISRKYDFGGLFIQALTAAIAANGVIISNDNFMNSTDNVYSQTISQWQGSMVNSQAISGLFQQQPIAMQGQGNWTVGGIYGVGGMM